MLTLQYLTEAAARANFSICINGESVCFAPSSCLLKSFLSLLMVFISKKSQTKLFLLHFCNDSTNSFCIKEFYKLTTALITKQCIQEY